MLAYERITGDGARDTLNQAGIVSGRAPASCFNATGSWFSINRNVQHICLTEAKTGVVMKPVVQLEQTGCGIASVAALTGVSYRSAQREAGRLGIFANDSRLWSETRHVRRLLKEFGIRPANTEVPFTSWEALPDLALLAVKWHKEEGRAFWHWVVFWRGPHGPVVFDSKCALRRHVRTDFVRIKPKWFISIAGY